MALKKLGIGIQDFESLITGGFYYVDKTDLIHRLVTTQYYYFLSRPRRFGKSLLVSTLKCYFEGRKELFEGLAISKLESEWKKHPVISLSFAGSYASADALAAKINDSLSVYEAKYDIAEDHSRDWGVRIAKIVRTAFEKTGTKVVLLIDEYDAPLVNSLDNPELLAQLRAEMNNFFNPLKDLGPLLRFYFITGVSRFSQLSIFSTLNNPSIITMDEAYAGICGITKEELLAQFQPEIQALADKNGLSYDEACATLARKYDGYHFSKNSPDVYNPFSLVNALTKQELSNYWFGTGTPTILTRMIPRYNIDPVKFDASLYSSPERFDAPIESDSDPIPLLYQTGYLTIKDVEDGVFTLGFPNEEVAIGFFKCLLPYYAKDFGENDSFVVSLVRNLKARKLEEALTQMKAFIASIPYNAERQTEDHYKTVFYLIFRLITQFNVRTEVCSAAGRADMVVETKDAVYVFEFKLDANASADDALKQIDDKGYLIPYSAIPGKTLYKVGVAFDTTLRTIGEWRISMS